MRNQKNKYKFLNFKIDYSCFKKCARGVLIISRFNSNHGIALVAVLAILVVLAIMAASFTTLMNIENKQSSVHIASQQLGLLINSGLEYTKAIITANELNPDRHISSVYNMTKSPEYTKWIIIKDSMGKVVGRYRVRIEDEAGKVNVQKAFLLKKSKGTGWDTGEINLPLALGVSPKTAKKLIDYRFGKNKLPGARGDDDQNNLILMADGIDNNANGIIDENDEGINDSREYSAENLKGDDRKFSSMSELMNVLIGDKKTSLNVKSQMMREIPQRATIYSCDMSGSPTLPNEIPSDINCVTARECRKLLIKANADTPFEPNSTKQMQLAANIADYRDENHVLSTLGSTYGVEAICFNEVMANDESTTLSTVDARMPITSRGDIWKEDFGMIDNKRCAYSPDLFFGCIPGSPAPSELAGAKRFQVLDPRKAWHIEKDLSSSNKGKLKSVGGNKFKIYWLDAIGEKGDRIDPNIYMDSSDSALKNVPDRIQPQKFGKSYLYWPAKHKITEMPSRNQLKDVMEETLDVLKKFGMVKGKRPKLEKNYFKNSLAQVYAWAIDSKSKNNKSIGCFKITSSDADSITFENANYFANDLGLNTTTYSFETKMKDSFGDGWKTNYNLSVTISSWCNSHNAIAWQPEANQTFLFRSRRPRAGKYFKAIIGRPAFHPNYGEGSLDGYPDFLGVSGEIGGPYSEDKHFEKKMWKYNDGKPIKTIAGGWMKLLVTSSDKGISRDDSKGQMLGYIRFMAPEVSEMYNASATPVSLANWRVICNTGSMATQIGRIRQTTYYDQKLRRQITDNNPVVQPQGHFYLVNDTELFDAYYGNADNEWGSRADEQVPAFQMDEENWGVAFEVDKSERGYNGITVTLKDFDFDAREVFGNETVKFLDPDNADDPESWNNVFIYVSNQGIPKPGKDQFFMWAFGVTEKLKGANLMILGLPASGGIVSLTLKNEYDQVCSRTVDYGKVSVEEFGVTTEKIDPTKNTWVKRQNGSIGGTEKEAENKAMRSRSDNKFFIKNGPFGGIGEARNVSTGNDFERLGGSGDLSKGISALYSLSKYMASSHVRLESCIGDVTRVGWKQAFDEVTGSSLRSVQGKTGGRKLNKWIGHTLRFLTGPLRGEKYPIISNSKNTFQLSEKTSKEIPRSVPNRKALKPDIGDKFSIGSGYATPMCYTRKSGAQAVWTWENAILYPGTYDLYIYGLNDAIDTTEFLEENNNASMDVEVWNYKTKEFDMLKKRGKYGKNDSFNAGKIKPENISGNGSVKIQLTAHDVIERNTEDMTGKAMVGTGGKQTGIAWFNYAVITPVPVPGRVNINVAPPRLLASLPGINSQLAKNIYEGIDRMGKSTLKPYQNLGDILKVKGMTLDNFERCVNILALDSTFFTVEIEAQIFKNNLPLKENGMSFKQYYQQKMPVEAILASRTKRFVIDAIKKDDEHLKFITLENNFVR